MSNANLVAQQISSGKFNSASISKAYVECPTFFSSPVGISAESMQLTRSLYAVQQLVAGYEKARVDLSTQAAKVGLAKELAQERYTAGVDYLADKYKLSSEATELVAPTKFAYPG